LSKFSIVAVLLFVVIGVVEKKKKIFHMPIEFLKRLSTHFRVFWK